MITNVSVKPDISDHDCPLLTIARCPIRQKQTRRKIIIYSKADWEKFADFMEDIGEEIEDKLDSCSVNVAWIIFKSGIEKGMADFVSQKLTSEKDHQKERQVEQKISEPKKSWTHPLSFGGRS